MMLQEQKTNAQLQRVYDAIPAYAYEDSKQLQQEQTVPHWKLWCFILVSLFILVLFGFVHPAVVIIACVAGVLRCI